MRHSLAPALALCCGWAVGLSPAIGGSSATEIGRAFVVGLTKDDLEKAKRICVTPQRKDRLDQCGVAARAGDSGAAFFLGRAHASGSFGAEANQAEAVRWYVQAAKYGSGLSQTLLGIRYLCGDGVQRDDHEARRWFKQATEQGRHTGYFWMGYLTETGRVEKQDPAKALRWYQGALAYNEMDALFRIGMFYAEGRGVSTDQAIARQYFESAQSQATLESPVLGGAVYLAMGEVAASGRRPAPKEEQESLRNLRDRADQGDPDAAFGLGLAYFGALGVKEDRREAFEWFHRAALKGHSWAQFNVAEMYLRGWGVEKSPAEAVSWFQRASDGNDSRATYGLGWLYLQGIGTQRDQKRGVELIHQAAQKGEREAQTTLALLYAQGKHVAQDLDVAEKWWARRMSCEHLTKHERY
jgi:uncharacterized protein